MTDLTQPVERGVYLKVSREGAHATVRVWIGEEPHPGKCGELIMRREDWRDLLARFNPDRIEYYGDAEAWLNEPVIPPQPDVPALLLDGDVWVRLTIAGDYYYRSLGSDETFTWQGLWEFAAGKPIAPLVPQPERPAKPKLPLRIVEPEDFNPDWLEVSLPDTSDPSFAVAEVQTRGMMWLDAKQCREVANALQWLADRHDAKAGA